MSWLLEVVSHANFLFNILDPVSNKVCSSSSAEEQNILAYVFKVILGRIRFFFIKNHSAKSTRRGFH